MWLNSSPSLISSCSVWISKQALIDKKEVLVLQYDGSMMNLDDVLVPYGYGTPRYRNMHIREV